VLGSLTDRLPRILPFSRARERRRSPAARPISVSREVLLFVVGCALAAALIGGASFWEVNRAATAEAINDAEVITQIDARGVAPLLTSAFLAGNPAAIAAGLPALWPSACSAPASFGSRSGPRRGRSSTLTRMA
jgi:hypothetical protein